jgi:hypothetical protein
MVATWTVGMECDRGEFAEMLSKAPFDIVVIVYSTAVAEAGVAEDDRDADILEFLAELHGDNHALEKERKRWDGKRSLHEQVLSEKAVYCLTQSGRGPFVALHKAKVRQALNAPKFIRSRGARDGLYFGTLRLVLCTSRQWMQQVTIGIIDVRREVRPKDTEALAAWIILERLDMVTGFFGRCSKTTRLFVNDLAKRSRAISFAPMYQSITDGRRPRVHPSFWLFYGYYRAITVPETVPVVTENDVCLGSDTWEDMILLEDVPRWECNDYGNVFLQNIGHIKMKAPDWKRWFKGCFQTCIWLGTATSSRASMRKFANKWRKQEQEVDVDDRSRGESWTAVVANR